MTETRNSPAEVPWNVMIVFLKYEISGAVTFIHEAGLIFEENASLCFVGIVFCINREPKIRRGRII